MTMTMTHSKRTAENKDIVAEIINAYKKDKEYLNKVLGNVENKSIHINQVEAVRDNFCAKWRWVVSQYDKLSTTAIHKALTELVIKDLDVVGTIDVSKRFLIDPELFVKPTTDGIDNDEFKKWLVYVTEQTTTHRIDIE